MRRESRFSHDHRLPRNRLAADHDPVHALLHELRSGADLRRGLGMRARVSRLLSRVWRRTDRKVHESEFGGRVDGNAFCSPSPLGAFRTLHARRLRSETMRRYRGAISARRASRNAMQGGGGQARIVRPLRSADPASEFGCYMITNLWLLAQLLFRISWITGLGPAAIAIGVWEWWYRRKEFRERKLFIVSRTKWGERTVPVTRRDACLGAGARPVFSSTQLEPRYSAVGRGPALPPVRSRG